MNKYDEIILRDTPSIELLENDSLKKLSLTPKDKYDNIVLNTIARITRKRTLAPLPPSNPMDTILNIGSCVLLLDAISGMSGVAGSLNAVADLSGNNNPVAIVGAPAYTNTKWGGVLPAVQFTDGAGTRLLATIPNLAQPFTYVTVIDSYIPTVGPNSPNLVNASAGAISLAVAYSLFGIWRMFAGIVFTTTITQAASAGKYIRFDIWNGANSQSLRSGTSGGIGNAGAQATGTVLSIGARDDGTDAASVIVAAHALFSKALSAGEMATIQAFYTNRYPGINP